MVTWRMVGLLPLKSTGLIRGCENVHAVGSCGKCYEILRANRLLCAVNHMQTVQRQANSLSNVCLCLMQLADRLYPEAAEDHASLLLKHVVSKLRNDYWEILFLMAGTFS